MTRESEAEMVAVTVRLTRSQAAWLRSAADRVGDTPDALVRQAIQLLRRLSAFREVAPRPRAARSATEDGAPDSTA